MELIFAEVLIEIDILYGDVRCAHQTCCKEHIVANACLHETSKGYHSNGTYKWASPDISKTVSVSDAAIKLARLKASTKAKSSDSAPLLNPTSPPPTTSITSSSSCDSPLVSKPSTLVTVSPSTTISASQF